MVMVHVSWLQPVFQILNFTIQTSCLCPLRHDCLFWLTASPHLHFLLLSHYSNESLGLLLPRSYFCSSGHCSFLITLLHCMYNVIDEMLEYTDIQRWQTWTTIQTHHEQAIRFTQVPRYPRKLDSFNMLIIITGATYQVYLEEEILISIWHLAG